MWHFIFSHAILTTVWSGSKMRPNPMEIPSFLKEMPWKFHDLTLSKIHVMFQHGKQIKTSMNDMEFGVDLGQTEPPSRVVTWIDMEILWKSTSHFLQGYLLFHYSPLQTSCRLYTQSVWILGEFVRFQFDVGFEKDCQK